MWRQASLILLSLLPLIGPAVAAAPPAANLAVPRPRAFFVLIQTAGPHWDKGKDFAHQAGIQGHAAYMRWFFAHGKLLLGGPFLDNSGGMAVFAVPTEAVALHIAAADPAVESGVLRVTVKPWLDVFVR